MPGGGGRGGGGRCGSGAGPSQGQVVNKESAGRQGRRRAGGTCEDVRKEDGARLRAQYRNRRRGATRRPQHSLGLLLLQLLELLQLLLVVVGQHAVNERMGRGSEGRAARVGWMAGWA